jgi:hypothetical protein
MDLNRKGKILWRGKPGFYPVFWRKTVEASIDLNRVKALSYIPFKWVRLTLIPRIAIS